jgi:hypothetical protein
MGRLIRRAGGRRTSVPQSLPGKEMLSPITPREANLGGGGFIGRGPPPADSDSDSDDGLSLADLRSRTSAVSPPLAPKRKHDAGATEEEPEQNAQPPSAKKGRTTATAAADSSSSNTTAAAEGARARRLRVGDVVQLAQGVGAAAAGVLRSTGAGVCGVVTEVSDDPDDDEPYQVKARASDETWWYGPGQLVLAESGDEQAAAPTREEVSPKAEALDALDSALEALADSDESEEEEERKEEQPLMHEEEEGAAPEPPARYRPQDGGEDDNDADDDDELTLEDLEESDGEEEAAAAAAAAAAQQAAQDTWQLVNSWVSVEFETETEEMVGKRLKQVVSQSWHQALVVDYDRTKGQHLLKWAETAAEEWVPQLRRGEYEAIPSRAEEKLTPVVFNSNVQMPPRARAELQGVVYRVLAPVKIQVAASRDSATVGECRVGELLKVLEAVELSTTGQLRVMSQKGWASVASRKGARFMTRTKTRLTMMREDKAARRRVERRAREEEQRRVREENARKLSAEREHAGWQSALARAKARAARLASVSAMMGGGGGGGAGGGGEGSSAGYLAKAEQRRQAMTMAIDDDDDEEEEEEEEEKGAVAAQQLMLEAQVEAVDAAEQAAQEGATRSTDGGGSSVIAAAQPPQQEEAVALLQACVLGGSARRAFVARRRVARGLGQAARGWLARRALAAARRQRQQQQLQDEVAAATAAALAMEVEEEDEGTAGSAAAEVEVEPPPQQQEGPDDIDWGAVDLEAVEQAAHSQAQQAHSQQPPAAAAAAPPMEEDIDWGALDLEAVEQAAHSQAQQQAHTQQPAGRSLQKPS